MNDQNLFFRNMLALTPRNPELAAGISSAPFPENLKIEKARTGALVPLLLREGSTIALHSRYDPETEGKRLAAASPGGFVVVFGLGGGYHLLPLLKKKDLTGLLIVEPDISLVHGLMSHFDYSELLMDSRVILSVESAFPKLRTLLLERYLPVLYGNMTVWPLRSRVKGDRSWFEQCAAVLKEVPEALGRDYTVQSRFGKRWFAHTLANLPQASLTAPAIPRAKRCVITAAGPSLEKQMPQIRREKARGARLIATDTSLPVLCEGGIEPDMVLSMDCQSVSYHHFFKGLSPQVTLVLDLASPPVLTRLSPRLLFFSSGHPFSLYLNRRYRPFPILDTSGGNVTHAALSLAHRSGAETVRLFGADYSYPGGKPYARGTYLYPFFQSRSTRTGGGENSFWSFMTRSGPWRESAGGQSRLRTAAMDHYREALEKTANLLPLRLEAEPGEGVPLRLNQNKAPSPEGVIPLLTSGPAQGSWQQFLVDYLQCLKALPPLLGPPQDYLSSLKAQERQAWATLLPAATSFRQQVSDGPQAVEAARTWTMERLSRFINRFLP